MLVPARGAAPRVQCRGLFAMNVLLAVLAGAAGSSGQEQRLACPATSVSKAVGTAQKLVQKEGSSRRSLDQQAQHGIGEGQEVDGRPAAPATLPTLRLLRQLGVLAHQGLLLFPLKISK